MNKTYINLALFGVGGLIMWMLAFPLYTGNGQNILQRKSVMDFRKERDQDQENFDLALELQKSAKSETEAYENLDPALKSRIIQMIPKQVDIPRLFNDITILAKKSDMKLDDISYAKSSSPDGIESLSSYRINLSLSGDYLAFRDFIKSLQSSLQLYRISSVFFSSVKSSDSRNVQDITNQSNSSNGQKFNVSFDAYEFKN